MHTDIHRLTEPNIPLAASLSDTLENAHDQVATLDEGTAEVQSPTGAHLPASEPVDDPTGATASPLLPQREASPPPQRQQSYEYTDLDLLVARLEEPSAAAQGAAYDDLLVISDIIGPAVDAFTSARDRENERAVEELPVAHVQVERRRITKDGRKKLKLSLMGVIVDRCSVCMSQFKKEELGVLLPCQHS